MDYTLYDGTYCEANDVWVPAWLVVASVDDTEKHSSHHFSSSSSPAALIIQNSVQSTFAFGVANHSDSSGSIRLELQGPLFGFWSAKAKEFTTAEDLLCFTGKKSWIPAVHLRVQETFNTALHGGAVRQYAAGATSRVDAVLLQQLPSKLPKDVSGTWPQQLGPFFRKYAASYLKTKSVTDVPQYTIANEPSASELLNRRVQHPCRAFRGVMSYVSNLWYRERQNYIYALHSASSPSGNGGGTTSSNHSANTLSLLNDDIMWCILSFLSGLDTSASGTFCSMVFWGSSGGPGPTLTFQEHIGETVNSVTLCVAGNGIPVIGAKWGTQDNHSDLVTLSWEKDVGSTRSTKPEYADIYFDASNTSFCGRCSFPCEGWITWYGGKSGSRIRAALPEDQQYGGSQIEVRDVE